MATTIRTWPFETTVEGWTSSGGTGWLMGYRSGEGNPAGSLRGLLASANSLSAAQWSITGTWADLFGIGADVVVLQVRIYGLDWRCQEFSLIDELRLSSGAGANANGLQYIGSSNRELWAGTTITGITGWASIPAGTNQSVPVADRAATSEIELRVNFWGDTANNPAAMARILVDNVAIEITYESALTVTRAMALSGADPATIARSASLIGAEAAAASRALALSASAAAAATVPVRLWGQTIQLITGAASAEIAGTHAQAVISPSRAIARCPDA